MFLISMLNFIKINFYSYLKLEHAMVLGLSDLLDCLDS